MFDIERWQEIFETIGKNKLRTFFTGLSVASGIFILVILLGFSTGIQKGVKTEFAKDAESSVSVRTRVTTKEFNGLNPGRRIQMHNSDYENINAKFEDAIEYKTGLYNIWGAQVNYKNETGNYRIEGANPEQQFIENATLTAGRFLSDYDDKEGVKVAIIGQKVKNDLFKKTEAIGETIQVFGINFLVAGVYSDPGGEREESRIFIPLSTAQRVFNAGDDLRSLAYTIKMSDNFDEAVALSAAVSQGIEDEIKSRYQIAPDDQSAVRVNYNLKETAKIYSLIDIMRIVFWGVGIGTIIAGVVGVASIMLIVVKERTKEIGIRKALGALPSSITGMILQESIFVTAIAGFLGLFFGVVLLDFIIPIVLPDNPFIQSPTVDFKTSLTTVLILIIAGAIAGYIPARRAANIKPIEALRDE